jgi:hypothetical protein
VIREQDRRKVAAIPSTGIDYFSMTLLVNFYTSKGIVFAADRAFRGARH